MSTIRPSQAPSETTKHETEARLFQCSLTLNSAGEQLELKEVPYGDLVWRNPISQHPNTIMKVVNVRHLEKLMRTTARSATRLVELTLPELANVAGSLDPMPLG